MNVLATWSRCFSSKQKRSSNTPRYCFNLHTERFLIYFICYSDEVTFSPIKIPDEWWRDVNTRGVLLKCKYQMGDASANLQLSGVDGEDADSLSPVSITPALGVEGLVSASLVEAL